MPIYENTELSPREHMIMEHDAEQSRLNREHAVTLKQLEIELAREKYTAEVELKRLDAKWSSWLKIPILIIKLPVYILFSFAYCIAVLCRVEPSKSFWQLLK